MKHLFDRERVDELKLRLGTLTPETPRLWGKMSAAQAVAHCSLAMEWAVGDQRPKRMVLGHLLGPVIKTMVFRNENPMPRNAGTMPELIVRDEPDLAAERERLCALLDRFATAGPAACTTHPHPLFGEMTPDEWAVLTYQHTDHHLRQFGV